MKLEIYRNGDVLATVTIDEQTVYRGQLMGENKIVSSFSSPTSLDLRIGDYILHKNKQWRINESVKEGKFARNKFNYEVVFEGREYTWHNKQVVHLGVTDFSYFGTLLEVLTLVLNNINEIDSGWLLGTIDSTEEEHFNFTDKNCAQALTMIAEQVGVEYKFIDRTLHVKESIGELIPDVTLSQGKGKGLYTLTRQNSSESAVATRVRGYGGSANLPANYRNGMRRLSFDPGYVENNIELYGIIEASITFEEIYPKRTAAITGTADPLSVIDTTLDFDLNDVIVQGQAKIVFKSGDLGGNEFEISSYDHATKTISFIPNEEENGYTLPNATVKAEIGNLYTLVGMEMPPSYIVSSENDVKARTEEYADTIKHPPLSYSLEIDQLEAKKNSLDINLSIGDKLNIVEEEWNVDEILRVQGITYPLTNPAKITAVINDKVIYSVAEKIRKEVAEHKTNIKEITKESAELRRINAIRRRELQGLVFDPEGYFDSDKIKPLSVETMHLAVGSRSQEFALTVVFKPNFNGSANRIAWTNGVLTHFTIQEQIKAWAISSGSLSGMESAKAYYIYAKCSKTGSAGTIVIDEAQRKVDSDPDYYYFLVGVLSSVIEGLRWPTLTYGTTEINGGFVRTGRITSNDGLTWFDLDSGEFRGKFKFTSGQDVEDVIDALEVTSHFVTLSGGQIITYEDDTPTPSSITISASEHNYTSAPSDRLWETKAANQSTWVSRNPIVGDPSLILSFGHNAAWWNGSDSLSVRYTVDGLSDEIQIVKVYSGTEGYTVILSNESHTVPANADGSVNSGGFSDANSEIIVYKGAAQLSAVAANANPGANQFRYNITLTTGGYSGRINNSNFAYTGFGNNSVMKGLVELDIWVEGKQHIKKTFSISKSMQGVKGSDGSDGTDGADGINGADGSDGERGPLGPTAIYRGEWDSAKIYYGGDDRIEIVSVDNGTEYPDYWKTKITSGEIPQGTPIQNSDYWEVFGAQFENIATGLLFAKMVYADNLTTRNLQTDIPGRKRAELDGIQNNFSLIVNGGSINSEPDPELDRKVIEIDDDSTIDMSEMYYFDIYSDNAGYNFLTKEVLVDRRDEDWSELNPYSIDSRTGLQPDFTNGFPKGYSGIIERSGPIEGHSQYKYYFYKVGAGFSVSDDLEKGDINYLGNWGLSVSHIQNRGSLSVKTRVLRGDDTDYPVNPDLTIKIYPDDYRMYIIDETPTEYIMLPSYGFSSHEGLIVGREITISNYSSHIRTVMANADGIYFLGDNTGTNSIDIEPNETITFQLLDKHLENYASMENMKWFVISLSELITGDPI